MISSGGGMSNSSAASSGLSGDVSGLAGGQTFNFVPPQSLQQKTISTPVVMGLLAVGGLWLFLRNK